MSDNNIALTLLEKTTIDDPFYFIELYSNLNKDIKLLKLNDDISPNPIRYNEYIIKERELINEDLDNQIISLDIGTYDYYVWLSATSSNNKEDAIKIVESGKCVVIGEFEYLSPNYIQNGYIINSGDVSFVNNQSEYTFKK